jgi:hypothetical protein
MASPPLTHVEGKPRANRLMPIRNFLDDPGELCGLFYRRRGYKVSGLTRAVSHAPSLTGRGQGY